MNEQKAQAIRAVLSLIEKQFGKGAVMRMGDQPRTSVDVVPTGSLALDAALGIGGLPRGRVVEIFGPESSGKTTLTLEIVAQAQQLGLSCAFIDAEHALDPDYARTLNVDVDDLLMSQPDTGEQALEITDMLVRSGAVDVIIIDSVAALVPKAELEGEMGAQSVGVQARLLSQGLRKLAGIVSANNTLVIFINQIRMKIGVMFGSPETTTGGNALKFYSSVRIDIRAAEKIKEGEEIVGVKARVKVVKNKLAAPFRVAEYSTLFGKGIWWQEELVRLGIEHGLLEKSGAWISYQGIKIGQGVKNAAQYLDEDRETAVEIDDALRNSLIVNREPEGPEPVSDDQVDGASAAA